MRVASFANDVIVPFSLTCSYSIFLLTLLLESLLVYNVLANCHIVDTKTSPGSCQANQESKMSETGQNNALAVVLYEEDTILPMHKQHRTFRYANHDISIQQDWRGLGVAAVVWDAAEVLGDYLEAHPDIVRGKSVLELGAGTGLVGIVAVLLGGLVTITDRAEVLPFLEKTVNRNIVRELQDNAKVLELDWTKTLDEFEGEYDIVVGADIVYIEEVFEDLVRTLRKLTNAKTMILLSCRIRYDRDTYFLSRLEEFFMVENILYDKLKDVNLYKVIKRI